MPTLSRAVRSRGVCAGALVFLIGMAPAGRSETRTVAPNPRYAASKIHQLWFGKGYRDLWATSVELEVLDLQKEAGGLRVLRRVGGMQTPGLALVGADGRSYTFRWIDKDPSRLLPREWRETALADYVRDQTAASHPGVWPVEMALYEQIGYIPFTPQRLVVMPDDPALGEYRELFAGAVGSFGEYPMPAHDGIPGFMGATEIISSKELWNRWREGPENRIDSVAFLRERLTDLWTGNWDRHRSQWRWARIPSQGRWIAIPEDPDQTFSDYGGLLISLARLRVPFILDFGDRISGMEGAVHNGADVDRWLLSDLTRQDFADAAAFVQARLTDEVIETAVRAMPPEWYALDGKWLARKLESRRDDLARAAQDYYRFLAGEVNIHATHRGELARVHRFDDGSLEVTVALDESDAEPYFRRRFEPGETRNVRLYLHGGNDRIESEGPASGRIKVHVLGGEGNDILDDSRGGGTRFVDWQGENRIIKGRGTTVDRRPWTNPEPDQKAPWVEPRDYNRVWLLEALAYWTPDLGLYAGGGVRRTAYGFRKEPFANSNEVFVGFSSQRTAFRLSYEGTFRRESSGLYGETQALVSGVERLNFFGFGNETAGTDEAERFRVDHTLYRLTPTINWSTGRHFEGRIGARVQLTSDETEGGLIDALRPYGYGDFGQVALVTSLEWDTRGLGRPGVLEGGDGEEVSRRSYTGLRVMGGGGYTPKVWDAGDDYGWVEGSLCGYLGLGPSERLVLASRVGGRHNAGDYPWHAAAFIGGAESNRGFRKERFAGDSSLFANFELRLRVVDTMPVVPGRLWLFGLADYGRVWFAGEDSNRWHPSYGGGLAFEVAGSPFVFWSGAAKAREDPGVRLYMSSGFSF